MSNLTGFRIDWINHTVGFLSALLGIYIAFRLEDYREERKEKERVQIVKQALKKEIDDNLKIYKKNVDELSRWLEYKDFYDQRWDRRKGGWVIGRNELSALSMKHGVRFSGLKEISSINDTLKIYDVPFLVDVAPTTGISTSCWKTTVASGILNSLDYSLTIKLSQVYDWIDMEIGTSEREVFENFLGINRKTTFADFDKLITHYRNIVRVQSLKYDQIRRIESTIDWNE